MVQKKYTLADLETAPYKNSFTISPARIELNEDPNIYTKVDANKWGHVEDGVTQTYTDRQMYELLNNSTVKSAILNNRRCGMKTGRSITSRKAIRSAEDEGLELTDEKLDEINDVAELGGDDMTKEEVLEFVQVIDDIADQVLNETGGDDPMDSDALVEKVEALVGDDGHEEELEEAEFAEGEFPVESSVKVMVQADSEPSLESPTIREEVIDDVPSVVYDGSFGDIDIEDEGTPDSDDVLVLGSSASRNSKWNRGYVKVNSTRNRKYIRQALAKVRRLTSGKMNKAHWALVSVLAQGLERKAQRRVACLKGLMNAYRKGIFSFKMNSAKSCSQSGDENQKKMAEIRWNVKHGKMDEGAAYKALMEHGYDEKEAAKLSRQWAEASLSQSRRRRPVKSHGNPHRVRIINRRRGALKSAYANIVDCMNSENFGDMDDLSKMLWGEGKTTFDKYIRSDPERCNALFEQLDMAFEHQDIDGDDCATLSITTLNDLLWFDKELLVENGVLPEEVLASYRRKPVKSSGELDPEGVTKVTPESVEGAENGYKEIKKVSGNDELENQSRNIEGTAPKTQKAVEVEGDMAVTSSMRHWSASYCHRNRLNSAMSRKIASALAAYTRGSSKLLKSSLTEDQRTIVYIMERGSDFVSTVVSQIQTIIEEQATAWIEGGNEGFSETDVQYILGMIVQNELSEIYGEPEGIYSSKDVKAIEAKVKAEYARQERERLFQSSSRVQKEAAQTEKVQIASNVSTMSNLMARMF